MPDVKITVGGKEFTVACREGEEDYLRTAAAMLDREATALTDQIGKLPESRMLLMAGLMLADRTAAYEERARIAESQLDEVPSPGSAGGEEAVRSELARRFARLAEEAEAVAATAEA
ncbi:MAG: cell division protein ZapA, partial [Deinococcus-Thermus bacterium]|nr:cell division protein ZapA [Deinococcota bacterium]